MKHVMRSFLLLSFAAFAFIGMQSCKSKPKDSDIQAAIEKAKSTTTEMAGLTATVKDGVVTLVGECKDDACKAVCESAVKAIPGVTQVVNNASITPPPPPPAPVTIAADDPLLKGVTDAAKDFPGVTAVVKDGVVTLTGDLKRSDLPKLMKSLNTLKPKKIDNKLTLK